MSLTGGTIGAGLGILSKYDGFELAGLTTLGNMEIPTGVTLAVEKSVTNEPATGTPILTLKKFIK